MHRVRLSLSLSLVTLPLSSYPHYGALTLSPSHSLDYCCSFSHCCCCCCQRSGVTDFAAARQRHSRGRLLPLLSMCLCVCVCVCMQCIRAYVRTCVCISVCMCISTWVSACGQRLLEEDEEEEQQKYRMQSKWVSKCRGDISICIFHFVFALSFHFARCGAASATVYESAFHTLRFRLICIVCIWRQNIHAMKLPTTVKVQRTL